MGKKKKNIIPIISGITLFVVFLLWIAMPVIAGMFKIGDPSGPKIYPKEMHVSLFKMGHSAAGHGTPSSAAYMDFLYERPLFYGMDRKLIARSETEKAWENAKDWIHEKTE